MLEEERGSFEGAIRTPPHASSFFFNDLAFLVIPRKSLKFLTPLFSIPTAPTITPDDSVALTLLNLPNSLMRQFSMGTGSAVNQLFRVRLSRRAS